MLPKKMPQECRAKPSKWVEASHPSRNHFTKPFSARVFAKPPSLHVLDSKNKCYRSARASGSFLRDATIVIATASQLDRDGSFMKPSLEPLVNPPDGLPSKVDSRWIRNLFEFVVHLPRVLSHGRSWEIELMESWPSAVILALHPRYKTFAVACFYRRGLDIPKCYLEEG